MAASPHHSRYLTEMVLHRLGIGEGHGKTGPDTPGRADCAEEVGTFVALVGGLARPCSPTSPLPDSSVLLPDARLILEPDFDLPAMCAWWQMRFQRRGEIFLNASMTAVSCLG